MLPTFSKEQKAEILSSLRRFFTQELDAELSEIQAGFLVEYFFKELGPLAYNQGVEDARRFLMAATEDLSGSCFQEALTFWKTKSAGREVPRKPGR